ncbi:MAG: hypothetical protein D6788_02350 [Planctomycetota bacterium]|nr:MAG: hypothetical protein D6788_02350 [Planctomycetota bacterium]
MTRTDVRDAGSWVRRALVLFVLLTCLRVWLGPLPDPPQARAQIPDSGLQRKQILEEARRSNKLLAEIKDLLQNGTLNVRLAGADKKATSGRGTRAGS